MDVTSGGLNGATANSGVNRYDGTTGAFIDTFVSLGSGGLAGPIALRFGPDDNLYVSSCVTMGRRGHSLTSSLARAAVD